jgi:hypothetical protein
LRFGRVKSQLVQVSLAILLVSVASGLLMYKGTAQLTSNYLYSLTVNREGFTTVEIDFNSTDVSGDSWVFVPKNRSSWTYSEISGHIVSYDVVETNQVTDQDLYFYQAFKFNYQSENNLFKMTIKFTFNNGALIIEPRGIFYSPFIGFKANSNGNAEVLFNSSFEINPDLAIVVGSRANYPAQKVEINRVLFRLQENMVRLQVEFSVDADAVITPLRSGDNKTFTFNTVSRYRDYAIDILRFYDNVYDQTARLFNVTLEDVVVQWFLPDFESLLAVGGFVPVFTGGLGEININIVFIRTVNGTVEDIAMHELVHRFLGKAGIPPNEFLWFHEGMAQYISITTVSNMGYEGVETEKTNLESSAESLIQLLGGENFGEISLQHWSPSFQPPTADVNSLYAASYYVTSRLPQIVRRDGFEYYADFFELIGKLPAGLNGEKVTNISELALYLSQAANASVTSTLKRWGFTVADLYESPVQDLIIEAGKAVGQVNPIFQPYRFLAGYLYQQALLSAETGDWSRTQSLLQLSITVANLAPLLTFLTIAAILALLSYALVRRSRRPRLVVPPPPPEIMGSSV